MTKCTNCKREFTVTVWQRTYPDVNLCRECALLPMDVLLARIHRASIAQTLWNIHRTSPAKAHAALSAMRGTGVPPNPKRRSSNGNG